MSLSILLSDTCYNKENSIRIGFNLPLDTVGLARSFYETEIETNKQGIREVRFTFLLFILKMYVVHYSIIQEWLVLTQEIKTKSLLYIYVDCVLLFYENLFNFCVVIANVKLA
jgi:hypothetical protein